MRRAFTLIELLVVIAVVALLVGLLAPALGKARESGRSVVCLSNLRQMFVVCRAYADENRGYSPVLGTPYGTLPNWALVVQSSTGVGGATSSELYAAKSVLVCPTSRGRHGEQMQRTYAINTTGHAGLPGDPDNYDTQEAAIRMDRIDPPGRAVMFVDSAPAFIPPPAPPPTRTASVLDFRDPVQVTERLGRVHSGSAAFNAAFFDGAAHITRDIDPVWSTPLP